MLPLLLIFASHAAFDFDLMDAHGVRHRAIDIAKSRATVLVFLGTDCPNSNAYAPTLERLYRQFAPRGSAFFAVYSDPDLSAGVIRKHDAEYRITFPALLDPHQVLARQTGARTTPEAVILAADGQVLYRGRIDDRFAAFGTTRYKPKREDLREALDEIYQGKPVSQARTPVLGCAIANLGEAR